MNERFDVAFSMWVQKQVDGFKFPVWGILLAILIVPLIFYIHKFGSLHLSPESIEWANFSTFISPFIALAGTYIVGILTYKLYQIEIKRDVPFLGITDEPTKFAVKNMSGSTAININVIRRYSDGKPETPDNPISLCVPSDSFPIIKPFAVDNCESISITFTNIHDIAFKIVILKPAESDYKIIRS